MRWLKLLAASFSLVSLLQLTCQQVAADENFYLTLNSTYTVASQGQTSVEHVFKIKNLTPTTYLKKYGLKISSVNIDNIRVSSNGQRLEPEIVKTNRHTSIGVTFVDEIVGEGKERELRINYDNPDVALISGRVLEVVIPKQAEPNDYNEYQVNLVTPKQFGAPTRATPGNYFYRYSSNYVVTEFDNLGGQGISAIFGDSQLFELQLRYHLQNLHNQAAITQISFPPDTPHQKIHYQVLEPLPTEMAVDADGNWIATYRLDPNSTTTVNVVAKALITLQINQDIPVYPPQTEHLQTQEYWQFKTEPVSQLATQYQQPKTIYQYVVSNLEYTNQDLSQGVERLGAIEALNQVDQATCQEFTDLFISLARANQIPARRVLGYAYAQNSSLRPLSLVKDVLHAWPQYFDQQQQRWVNIDPTWGHTTGGVDYFNQFDLNHVAFAFNGLSSTLPIPAGAYKLTDIESKDVEVKFGTEFPTVDPQFNYQLVPQKLFGINLPGKYFLEITNATGRAWYNLGLDIETNSTTSNSKLIKKITALLPYQTLKLPVTIYNKDWLPTTTEAVITIKSGVAEPEIYHVNVITSSSLYQFFSAPPVLVALGVSLVIIPLAAGSLFLLKRR